MDEGGIEKRKSVRPLDWRKLVPNVLVKNMESSLEHEAGPREVGTGENLAAVLDSIAEQAARKGVDFEALAAPDLQKISTDEDAGRISEGQAEFMRDEQDALLKMIHWAFEQGLIDASMRTRLRETVN